jgi:hypothetical protein
VARTGGRKTGANSAGGSWLGIFLREAHGKPRGYTHIERLVWPCMVELVTAVGELPLNAVKGYTVPGLRLFR